MKLSIYFLIVSTFLVFHLSSTKCALVLVGYALFSYIDWRISEWRKERILCGFFLGWEKDAEDPHMENKGDSSRIRLDDTSQSIVTRIIEVLREM